MRLKTVGLSVTVAALPCLCLLASAQNKPSSQPSAKIIEMRRQTDAYGRAFAVAVQARAIKNRKYDNSNMGSYAEDLGGKIPLNPCTGTRTGYTMTVSPDGKSAGVAASAGTNCGNWTPKVYRLKL